MADPCGVSELRPQTALCWPDLLFVTNTEHQTAVLETSEEFLSATKDNDIVIFGTCRYSTGCTQTDVRV